MRICHHAGPKVGQTPRVGPEVPRVRAGRADHVGHPNEGPPRIQVRRASQARRTVCRPCSNLRESSDSLLYKRYITIYRNNNEMSRVSVTTMERRASHLAYAV